MYKFKDIADVTVDAIHDMKEETDIHPPALSRLHKEDAEEEEEEEEKSADTKRRDKVKEHFKDMTENTSFHGVNYVIDEQYPLRRLIWLAVTLTAFIYSLTKVHQSMMLYLSYPFATARMRYYVNEIEFPKITLCNLNDMRLSTMNGTTIDRAIIADNITMLENLPDEEWMHKKINGTHKIEEMLVECIFDGMECKPENFTRFESSLEDTCYTFGTDRLIQGPGVRRSLMLTLNTQHYDYYRDYQGLHGGFRMVFHGKRQLPMMMDGIRITPGFTTYAQVEKMKIKNLKSPYKTHCDSKKLKYYETYSIDTCIMEQKTDYIKDKCGCKPPSFPGNITICTHMDECAWPEWQKFDGEKLWNCPLPCEIDSYQLKTISYSLFPSKSYSEELRGKMEKMEHMKEWLPKANDTTRFMRDNLLRLIVFYDDLSFELSEQQPSYNLAAFLGDVGGQFSLFIGAGVMSYFELVDCLGLVLYTRFFESFTPQPAKI